MNVSVSQNGILLQKVQLSARLNPAQANQLGRWVQGTDRVLRNGTIQNETYIHEATYYIIRGETLNMNAPSPWYGAWDDIPLP